MADAEFRMQVMVEVVLASETVDFVIVLVIR